MHAIAHRVWSWHLVGGSLGAASAATPSTEAAEVIPWTVARCGVVNPQGFGAVWTVDSLLVLAAASFEPHVAPADMHRRASGSPIASAISLLVCSLRLRRTWLLSRYMNSPFINVGQVSRVHSRSTGLMR